MKLKTLKELKREWEYDAELDAVVPFKDGEPIGCSNDIVIFDELKSEAINWINSDMREDRNWREMFEDFFNITEEELSK